MDDVPLVCGIALLQLPEVERMVGIKHTQIYRLGAEDRFPGPVPLGERAARWVLHEVQEWLRQRCPPPGAPPGGDVAASNTASLPG